MKSLLKPICRFGLAAVIIAAPALRAEITSWLPLGPGGPINADPTKSIGFGPKLATLKTSDGTEKLYAVWAEQGGANSVTNQVRAAVYQDKSPTVPVGWKQIGKGVNGTLPINYDPKAAAFFPHLVVHRGSLYATWQEYVPSKGGRTISRIRVSCYNGNDATPNWNFIDGNATGGLNLNASQNAINPVATSYGDQLVVTWAETAAISRQASAQQVRARAYTVAQNSPPRPEDGGWTWLDGGLAAGLNVDPNKSAQPALPVVLDVLDVLDPPNVLDPPKLYVCFREPSSTGITQLRVKEHLGGSSWKVVDGGSLNRNPDRKATSQFSGTDGASIYCVWSEVNASGVEQIRASRYPGPNATAPGWQRLDGADPDPERGLNYQNTLAYGRPRAVQSFNGKIYVHWMEEWREAGITQNTCRVAVWDETLLAQNQWPWAWADGGAPRSNVEFNAPTSYTSSLTFGVYNSKLLLFNLEQFPYPQASQGHVLFGLENP